LDFVQLQLRKTSFQTNLATQMTTACLRRINYASLATLLIHIVFLLFKQGLTRLPPRTKSKTLMYRDYRTSNAISESTVL